MGAGPSVQTRLDHVLAVAGRVVEQHKHAPYSVRASYFVPPGHAADFWDASRERSSAEIFRLRCIVHELHDVCRQIIAHTRSTQLGRGMPGAGLSAAALRSVAAEAETERRRRRELRRRAAERQHGGADGLFFGDSDSDMDLPRSVTYSPRGDDRHSLTRVRPDELLDGSVPFLSLSEQAAQLKRREREREREDALLPGRASGDGRRSRQRRRGQQSARGRGGDRPRRRQRGDPHASSKRKQLLLLEYLEELERRIDQQQVDRRYQQRGRAAESSPSASSRARGRGGSPGPAPHDAHGSSPSAQSPLQIRHISTSPRGGGTGGRRDDGAYSGGYGGYSGYGSYRAGENYANDDDAASPTLRAYRRSAAALSDRFAQSRAATMAAYDAHRQRYPGDKRGGVIAGSEGRWRDSLRSPRPQEVPLPARRPSPYPAHPFRNSNRTPPRGRGTPRALDIDDVYGGGRAGVDLDHDGDDNDDGGERLGALRNKIARLTEDISAIHDGPHEQATRPTRLQELREMLEADSLGDGSDDDDDDDDYDDDDDRSATSEQRSNGHGTRRNDAAGGAPRTSAPALAAVPVPMPTPVPGAVPAPTPAPASAPSPTPLLRPGQKVRANYGGAGKWYPGSVAAANGDGTFDLLYDDGDRERGVPADRVRAEEGGGSGGSGDNAASAPLAAPAPVPDAAAVAPAPVERQLAAGDKVEGNYGGEGKWYAGCVAKVNGDGSYDVAYDDGDHEAGVPADRLRPVGGGGGGGGGGAVGAAGAAAGGAGDTATAADRFQMDEAVECRYGGQMKWFRGRISNVRAGDGTYDIAYDDGDAEQKVSASLIRRTNAPRGAGLDATVRTTATAAATAVADAGGGGAADDARNVDAEFGVNDIVEFRDSTDSWVRGSVVAVQSNGRGQGVTYNIMHEPDGSRKEPDVETEVPKDHIRRATAVSTSLSATAANSGSGGSSAVAFSVGDAVEGNFGGKGKWYRGTVSACNAADGTFDLRYEDGDMERGVAPSNIRRVGGHSSGGAGTASSSSSASSASASAGGWQVDDTVEANFGCKGAWYPGRVEAVHDNGASYDILYDDGDRERGVRPDCVRPRGGGVSSGGAAASLAEAAEAAAAEAAPSVSANDSDTDSGARTGEFAAGDTVEANYAGKGKWYSGTVASVNGNGTYDVRYDDGDSERGVAPEHVRRVGGGSGGGGSSSSSSSDGGGGGGGSGGGALAEGDVVEGNYGGQGKWYCGKVARVNDNGTVDIRYDDGDAERGVAAENVRRPGSGRGGGGGGEGGFAEGDKVEANYGGQGKWYPGTVSAARASNGTFDVLYDDGDREMGVPADRLRAR